MTIQNYVWGYQYFNCPDSFAIADVNIEQIQDKFSDSKGCT